MTQIPIAKETIDRIAAANKIQNPGKASIREMRKMIQDVEKETGVRFVKMEMGIPGLPAPQVGVQAQIEALKSGVASIYPEIYGTADFKKEAARFVKNFLDIDVTPDCCVPTVGSMQAGFASFLTLTRYDAKKTKVLFIDPGFPVQKQQCRVLGIPMKAFDVYEYRGDKLRDKLEEELKDGDVACMIFSSPNNPAWFCFTDHELQIIGEMANKYGVVVMEDSAYFLMDFRKDYSVPGKAPFQPTVAKYTDLYVIMISGSKSFSYAGERIAMMVVSPKLFNMECPDLARYYSQTQLGRALIFGTLYCLSSGTAHSVRNSSPTTASTSSTTRIWARTSATASTSPSAIPATRVSTCSTSLSATASAPSPSTSRAPTSRASAPVWPWCSATSSPTSRPASRPSTRTTL